MHTDGCASIAYESMGFLDRFIRPDPEKRAAFERAAADVDRELAANIELSAMFDQTHHGVTFENAQFVRHIAVLRASAPEAFALLEHFVSHAIKGLGKFAKFVRSCDRRLGCPIAGCDFTGSLREMLHRTGHAPCRPSTEENCKHDSRAAG